MLERFTKKSIYLIVALISGCAIGPNYERPTTSANVANTFINSPEDPAAQSSSFWWERIDDPLLPGYIETVLAQNLDLKAAAARVVQARARLGIANSDVYPDLSTNIAAGRSFAPGQEIGGVSERQYTNSYTTELQASWEIDLFGRIQGSISSAEASFQASIYDSEALTYSLIAELINRRVAIAVNQRLLTLAEQNAVNRQQIYDLVEKRYSMGAQNSSLEDVLLARENFTTATADINQYKRLLADESYAFDILLGQIPGTTNSAATPFPVLPPPLDIPVCVPASLLDRRPDLKASELRLIAANADIGVAMADLYPGLNLTAALGFTDSDSSTLLRPDQLAGSILGSLTVRLFEGGRLRANVDLQKAEAEELIQTYASATLQAIADVESALQSENELLEEVKFLNMSVVALRQAESISGERYRSGLISLRNYLDTQQRLYQIEQSAILREQQKWNTRIALYLALGGDWLNEDSQQYEGCP